MSRPRYKEFEDEAILRGIAEGKSFADIAEDLPGRSEWGTCQRARNYLGYKPEGSKRPPEKSTAKPRNDTGRAKRKCLGPCGQYFESSWKGNRICKRCASSEIFQNSGAMA